MSMKENHYRATKWWGGLRKFSSNMFVVPVVSLFLIGSVSSQILDLSEGSKCTALGGEPGTCQLLTDCYNPGDFKKFHPPICTFRGMIPVICCADSLGMNPDDFRINVPTRALEYCRNYSNHCESLREYSGSAVILQGKSERPFEHSYMVVIGYGDQSNKVWNCGGSLISSRYILTAASCAEKNFLGPARWARLGGLEILFATYTSDNSTKDYRIVERIAHPDYSPGGLYHDIALFLLEVEVAFDLWLGPVCLHASRILPASGASATVWGEIVDLDFKGNVSLSGPNLLEYNMTLYEDKDCQRLMKQPSSAFPRGIDSKTMFCARYEDSDNTCTLDTNGGPLLISVTGLCIKTQIGVSSYSKQSCQPGFPTVFTRVSHYLPWIEKIVFPN